MDLASDRGVLPAPRPWKCCSDQVNEESAKTPVFQDISCATTLFAMLPRRGCAAGLPRTLRALAYELAERSFAGVKTTFQMPCNVRLRAVRAARSRARLRLRALPASARSRAAARNGASVSECVNESGSGQFVSTHRKTKAPSVRLGALIDLGQVNS